MVVFPCPYLTGEVELTFERWRHIAERHPDLVPQYELGIAETLLNPDQIRRSSRFGKALLFSRWFEVRESKYVVVVVVTDHYPKLRHWVITAYLTNQLGTGELIWQHP
jgi:hypothetical protein